MMALIALCWAALLPHLSALNYGLVSFEMFVGVALSVLVGGLLALIGSSRLSFGVILGGLIYFVLDAYLLEDKAVASVACVWCVLLMPLLLKLAPNGIPLAASIFGFIFGLQAFFSPATPVFAIRAAEAAVDGPKPDFAYLHIVLDEQMSPIAPVPGLTPIPAADTVLATYRENGFKTYAHADSIWPMTFIALTAMFGLTDHLDNFTEDPDRITHNFSVADNALVRRLAAGGFSTTIIESDYIGLCGDNPTVTCQTYGSRANAAIYDEFDLSLWDRLDLMFVNLHEGHARRGFDVLAYRSVLDAVTRLRGYDRPVTRGPFVMTMTGMNILDSLAAGAPSLEPGDALIAHVIAPHYPYVFDRECNFLNLDDWRNPVRYELEPNAARSYVAFWEQSICVHKKIEAILAAVEDRDDIVIMIHGDHGARVLSHRPERTRNDLQATFLAVKGPGIAPEMLMDTVNLQTTFAAEFEAIFGSD
jgi:hypothetical protein